MRTAALTLALQTGGTASLLWHVDGRCTVRFITLGKTLVLPVGIEVTTGLINKLAALL